MASREDDQLIGAMAQKTGSPELGEVAPAANHKAHNIFIINQLNNLTRLYSKMISQLNALWRQAIAQARARGM